MIPAWNLQGVIPPIRPGMLGHDLDRSPYTSELNSLVDMMGTSAARLEIINGLLHFRNDIHDLGITSGFQWLDGSFSENVEHTEKRGPRDIDVVTFLQLPPGEDEASICSKNPKLFDRAFIKSNYLVDSYWCFLGCPLDAPSIQLISYWYSLWSHRRDGMWKGFVQVDLDRSQDSNALQAMLKAKAEIGGKS